MDVGQSIDRTPRGYDNVMQTLTPGAECMGGDFLIVSYCKGQ